MRSLNPWRLFRYWYTNVYEPWYARWGPALVVSLAVLVAIVSVATSLNYYRLEADRHSREVENRALLGCFDQYASASAATSKAVRDAAVSVDSARVDRDRALQALFEYVAAQPAGPARDRPRGERLFSRLVAANLALVTAQRELDEVRAANPIPDPPSVFCELP